jgi:hypothetical protein
MKKPIWVEKPNNSKGLSKVEKITDRMSECWGTGSVVIPAPIEVDEIMRKVPVGNLININEIRSALARKPRFNRLSDDNRHLCLDSSACRRKREQ